MTLISSIAVTVLGPKETRGKKFVSFLGLPPRKQQKMGDILKRQKHILSQFWWVRHLVQLISGAKFSPEGSRGGCPCLLISCGVIGSPWCFLAGRCKTPTIHLHLHMISILILSLLTLYLFSPANRPTSYTEFKVHFLQYDIILTHYKDSNQDITLTPKDINLDINLNPIQL